MATPPSKLFAGLFSVFFFMLICAAVSPENEKRVYIVIVDPKSKPHPFPALSNWYSSLSTASFPFPLHRYDTVLHGFSATLTKADARRIEQSSGVLGVHVDYILQPETTRSPAFLGLDFPSSKLSSASNGGDSVIIGIIDTGISPQHPSFDDAGVGHVPSRWLGKCEYACRPLNRSLCNRKLVGNRFFHAGYAAAFGGDLPYAWDTDGHGTHVASIAAGAPVAGAEFRGFAGGVAHGMAPRARVAAYKACWTEGCLVSDVIAALDAAVSDGVDVISLSLGSSSPAPSYSVDPLAIATFRASMRGVFIAASAGNGGPLRGSVGNSPPWITTVGAATFDRDFPALILLGNGKLIKGISISLSPSSRLSHRYPLIVIGKITSLHKLMPMNRKINGTFVFWLAGRHVSRIDVGKALKRGGAAGMVVAHGVVDPSGLLAEPHVLPTIAVATTMMKSIVSYAESSSNPTVSVVSKGTVLIPRRDSRIVPSFSSRGPNTAVLWILKPDVTAPGVNILGAWTGYSSGDRQPRFNILSGTSMATPHVSGVAVLILAARPEWDPSEIRSALMTTAISSPVTDEASEIDAGTLAMGAGYISPEKALHPGLAYDLGFEDYVGLLCGLNYTDKEIKIVAGISAIKCKRFDTIKGIFGFNYPAFVAEGGGDLVFYRRLKMVDEGGRWYIAEVDAPAGYAAEVVPRRLWFGGKIGERLEFKLVLKRDKSRYKRSKWGKCGMLRWREEVGQNIVSSPIVLL